ncbi:MAG: hypothetical protein ACKV22_20215 [Bryobacteraceae bacterium]
MTIFMNCQLCNKRLPLFSRQTYCSPSHHKLDNDHQRSLYLARLADNAVEVKRLNAALEDRLVGEMGKPRLSA